MIKRIKYFYPKIALMMIKSDQKDKIFLSQNSFNDDKIWTNEQRKDITKKPDNNNYYSYNHEFI